MRVFVIGAGFSKNFSSHMPIMLELSSYFNSASDIPLENQNLKKVLRRIQLELEPHKSFLEKSDFEMLLTYLIQQHPWKNKMEIHADLALFEAISEHLGVYFSKKESQAFANGGGSAKQLCNWLRDFIKILDRDQSSIISFNYDTVIERELLLSRRDKRGYMKVNSNIYGIDLRESGDEPENVEVVSAKFTIFKLHGSRNWFYSGEGGFSGEEVFCCPVQLNIPGKGHLDICNVGYGPPCDRLTSSRKVPLIIPPVADKNPFYNLSVIRALWSEAHYHLSQADQIFFVGYSLPITDLATNSLLTAAVRAPKEVFIVNTDLSVFKRYREVFPEKKGIKLRTDFLGKCKPIETMVEFLKAT